MGPTAVSYTHLDVYKRQVQRYVTQLELHILKTVHTERNSYGFGRYTTKTPVPSRLQYNVRLFALLAVFYTYPVKYVIQKTLASSRH